MTTFCMVFFISGENKVLKNLCLRGQAIVLAHDISPPPPRDISKETWCYSSIPARSRLLIKATRKSISGPMAWGAKPLHKITWSHGSPPCQGHPKRGLAPWQGMGLPHLASLWKGDRTVPSSLASLHQGVEPGLTLPSVGWGCPAWPHLAHPSDMARHLLWRWCTRLGRCHFPGTSPLMHPWYQLSLPHTQNMVIFFLKNKHFHAVFRKRFQG